MKKIFTSLLLAIAFILAWPSLANAASLYFSPSSGSKTVGSNFSVSVGVNSGGVAINSAQGNIAFTSSLLEITSVSQSGIFTLWPVNPNYSNAAGTLTFAGGLPNPGYNGSAGTILTITFRAEAAGTASLSFNSGSVLANDGLGTNVLSSRGTGSFTINAPAAPPELNLPKAPTVSSPTHPDQSTWYGNNAPAFSWSKEDGVTGFSFALDDQETATPDQVRDTTGTSTIFSNITDGVWYFHVRAQNNDGWGGATHYRIRTDTSPPDIFSILLLDGNRTLVTAPRLSFEATDSGSGIDRYEVLIDGNIIRTAAVGETSAYNLPELGLGAHQVKVTALDKVGNKRDASTSFIIYSPDQPPPVEVAPPAEDQTFADKIVDSIKNILPAPVRQLTDNIGQLISRIQDNPEAEQFFSAGLNRYSSHNCYRVSRLYRHGL